MASYCGPLHTCELCGQDGLSEPEMRSHMQIVHVEGSPACPFCDLADLTHSEMVRKQPTTRQGQKSNIVQA